MCDPYRRYEDLCIGQSKGRYVNVLTSDANGIFWEYRKVKKVEE